MAKGCRSKRRILRCPSFRTLLHNIMKVAARYNVRIVFSAPCKLAKICPLMASWPPTTCTKKHTTRYTDRPSNIVYTIPLDSARYIMAKLANASTTLPESADWLLAATWVGTWRITVRKALRLNTIPGPHDLFEEKGSGKQVEKGEYRSILYQQSGGWLH